MNETGTFRAGACRLPAAFATKGENENRSFRLQPCKPCALIRQRQGNQARAANRGNTMAKQNTKTARVADKAKRTTEGRTANRKARVAARTAVKPAAAKKVANPSQPIASYKNDKGVSLPLLGGSLGKALASAPVKPVEAAPVAAKAPRMTGRVAALFDKARAGTMPQKPDFSADTHARFREKLNEISSLIYHVTRDRKRLPELIALRDSIKPISTSPKMMLRYATLAVLAFEAKAQKA